jgi:hypothetical protein
MTQLEVAMRRIWSIAPVALEAILLVSGVCLLAPIAVSAQDLEASASPTGGPTPAARADAQLPEEVTVWLADCGRTFTPQAPPMKAVTAEVVLKTVLEEAGGPPPVGAYAAPIYGVMTAVDPDACGPDRDMQHQDPEGDRPGDARPVWLVWVRYPPDVIDRYDWTMVDAVGGEPFFGMSGYNDAHVWEPCPSDDPGTVPGATNLC